MDCPRLTRPMLGQKFFSDKMKICTQKKLLYIFCELKLPKSDFQNQFSIPRVFLKKKKNISLGELFLLKFKFFEKVKKICAIFLIYLLSKHQNHEDDCAIFGGLLRKAKS